MIPARTALAAPLLVLLAACGQAGDLYLPGDPAAQPAPPPAAAPAPAPDDTNKKGAR